MLPSTSSLGWYGAACLLSWGWALLARWKSMNSQCSLGWERQLLLRISEGTGRLRYWREEHRWAAVISCLVSYRAGAVTELGCKESQCDLVNSWRYWTNLLLRLLYSWLEVSNTIYDMVLKLGDAYLWASENFFFFFLFLNLIRVVEFGLVRNEVEGEGCIYMGHFSWQVFLIHFAVRCKL